MSGVMEESRTLHRLNEDSVGELGADTKPGIANQANQVAMAAEQLDLLLLAQAEFAKAMSDFGRRIEALNSNSRASHHATQRTNERIARAAAFQRTIGTRNVH